MEFENSPTLPDVCCVIVYVNRYTIYVYIGTSTNSFR